MVLEVLYDGGAIAVRDVDEVVQPHPFEAIDDSGAAGVFHAHGPDRPVSRVLYPGGRVKVARALRASPGR